MKPRSRSRRSRRMIISIGRRKGHFRANNIYLTTYLCTDILRELYQFMKGEVAEAVRPDVRSSSRSSRLSRWPRPGAGFLLGLPTWMRSPKYL